jgi:hypothetical protein
MVSSELLIEPDSLRVNKLAGITYNNLACYYKKYQSSHSEPTNLKYR